MRPEAYGNGEDCKRTKLYELIIFKNLESVQIEHGNAKHGVGK
jgi:hypothetical protein